MKEGIVQTDRRARHDALEELREELIEGREEEEIPRSRRPLDAREGGFPRALHRGPQAHGSAWAGRDQADLSRGAVLPRVHGTGSLRGARRRS